MGTSEGTGRVSSVAPTLGEEADYRECSGFREGAAAFWEVLTPEDSVVKDRRFLWQPRLQVSTAAPRAVGVPSGKSFCNPVFLPQQGNLWSRDPSWSWV